MQKAKRFALATLVAAIAMLSPTLFGGTAHAAVQDCKTTTTNLNRPDHGHGTVNGGYWANLSIVRKTVICIIVDSELKAQDVQPPAMVHYHANVTDNGTLVTIAGATLSPNDAKPLKGGVKGVVQGSYTQDFYAEAGWLKYQGNFNGQTYSGTNNPSSTGDWVKKVWGGDDFKSKGLNDDWLWAYQTCVKEYVSEGFVEMWVDSGAKDNNDGQSDSAGDITGKPCPSASPSASHAATTPAGATPTPSVPSLPVTGANVPILLGGGGALLIAGLLIVGTLYMRKRRDRVRFVA